MITRKAVKVILENIDNLTTLEKVFLQRELNRAQKRRIILTEQYVAGIITGIQMHRIINA